MTLRPDVRPQAGLLLRRCRGVAAGAAPAWLRSPDAGGGLFPDHHFSVYAECV